MKRFCVHRERQPPFYGPVGHIGVPDDLRGDDTIASPGLNQANCSREIQCLLGLPQRRQGAAVSGGKEQASRSKGREQQWSKMHFRANLRKYIAVERMRSNAASCCL